MRTYTELISFSTFEDRFEYLKLQGVVGKDTFGFDREFNQIFYHSNEWKRIRDQVNIRDNGCDLGIDDRPIKGRCIIHHLNPITLEDLEKHSELIFNPEYLITVSHNTHNAIHYGDISLIGSKPIERKPNDTCPWK